MAGMDFARRVEEYRLDVRTFVGQLAKTLETALLATSLGTFDEMVERAGLNFAPGDLRAVAAAQAHYRAYWDKLASFGVLFLLT